MIKNAKGQTLMELVVGIALVAVIVSAVAMLGTTTLRNSEFSKNQAQATQLAQQNMEKVRTIKNSNFGVCLQEEVSSNCSNWEGVWTTSFGKPCATAACSFEIIAGCVTADGLSKPLCLKQKTGRTTVNTNFETQIILEDEVNCTAASGINIQRCEKKAISNVYWKDVSGEHSSQLVTILGNI